MNKATALYDAFEKAISTRDGIKIHTKNCVEVMLTQMERLISEYDKYSASWWIFTIQEIREDLEEL